MIISKLFTFLCLSSYIRQSALIKVLTCAVQWWLNKVFMKPILRSSSCRYFPNPSRSRCGLVTMLAVSVSQLRLLLASRHEFYLCLEKLQLRLSLKLLESHHLDASVISVWIVYVFPTWKPEMLWFPAFSLVQTQPAHFFSSEIAFSFWSAL